MPIMISAIRWVFKHPESNVREIFSFVETDDIPNCRECRFYVPITSTFAYPGQGRSSGN